MKTPIILLPELISIKSIFRARLQKRIAMLCLAGLLSINSFAGPNEDLVTAIKQGNLEGVKAALANGADVNYISGVGTADENGTLNHAILWPEITQFLIDKGADPNKGGKVQPLAGATVFMSVDVMKILLANGAKATVVTIVDPDANIRALISVQEGKLAEAKVGAGLTKGEKKIAISTNEAVLETFKKQLTGKQPYSVTTYPALEYAISMGCKECLELFSANNIRLKASEDPEGKRMQDFTTGAKMDAALLASSIVSMTDMLTSKGYKVPDWYKNYDISKLSSITDRLDYLLKCGYNINTKYVASSEKMTFGGTALSMAMREYIRTPEEVVLAIIKAGANINELDPKYGPLINVASSKGYVQVMKVMVAAGADINVESVAAKDAAANLKANGFTPLIMAALYDQLESAAYLLEAGVKATDGANGVIFDVKGTCNQIAKNKSAIYFAIDHINMAMIKLLVEKSAIDWSGDSFSTITIEEVVRDGKGKKTDQVTCKLKGKYSPAQYANAMFEKGELHKYLASKKL